MHDLSLIIFAACDHKTHSFLTIVIILWGHYQLEGIYINFTEDGESVIIKDTDKRYKIEIVSNKSEYKISELEQEDNEIFLRSQAKNTDLELGDLKMDFGKYGDGVFLNKLFCSHNYLSAIYFYYLHLL